MSSGYNFDRFVGLTEAEAQDLSCSICHEVLRTPVVTECCGQMFCKLCIEEWLKNSETCPFDRKTLTTRGLHKVPRMVDNKLSELKIKCDYEKRGCPEVVALHSLQVHLQMCHFRDICDKCYEKSQEFIEQLIRSNEESKKEIKRLEEESVNFVQTIQELTTQLDAIDPLEGPADKRVFKAWNQITFGLEIILNAREYLAENEPIVQEWHSPEGLVENVVDFVKRQLFDEKSFFIICKNVVQMLDMDYGNSWQCVADYDNSSVAYFTHQRSLLLKLRFGCLLFKIFKTSNSDEHTFVKRFRRPDVKHDIEVLVEENMNKVMIAFIKKTTFEAIAKLDTLREILCYIQKCLGDKFGGLWYCMAYSMGAFPMKRIKGYFIEFLLLDIKFTIFQIND